MEIPDRVQIVPLGYERDRVLEPVYRLKADRVVLLRQLAEDNYEATFQRDVVNALRDNDRIELEIRECDLFDLDSARETIVDVIEACEGDEVYVNVSTGSKITAIAAMTACQTTDAEPFYAEPEYRGDDGELEPPEEPIVDDVGDVYRLPTFDLDGPSNEQLEVLSYLSANDGATKKELIRISEERELPFIAESESKSDEGRYRLLETHIIAPLVEEGYVYTEKVGRQKHVYLGERGEDALRTFPTGTDS